MSEQPRAWIDYIIAGDDAVDKALLDEFRNRAWAHGQWMQFITSDVENINELAFARLVEEQGLSDALHERIYERGQALCAAGYSAANEAALAAWRATWVPLANYMPSEDGDIARA